MYEELKLIQKLFVDNFQRYRVRFHIDLEVIVIIKFGPNVTERTERNCREINHGYCLMIKKLNSRYY